MSGAGQLAEKCLQCTFPILLVATRRSNNTRLQCVKLQNGCADFIRDPATIARFILRWPSRLDTIDLAGPASKIFFALRRIRPKFAISP